MRYRDTLHDTDTEASPIDERQGGWLTGFLLGAVVGAGVALLLAPDSGQETRRHLSRRVRSMRKKAAQGFEQAEAEARRQMRRARRGLEDRMES